MARSMNGNLLGNAAHKTIDDMLDGIDEEKISPNARYWKNGTEAAYTKLVELIGREKAEEITGNWDDGRTWKQICFDTERLLKEAQNART